MHDEYFILYGTKDKDIYYIANINPIIWTSNIGECKRYFNRYSAEYDILRDYDNYRFITRQINDKILDNFFIAMIQNNDEKWRVKLL